MGFDVLLWQSLASVAVPGLTINLAVSISSYRNHFYKLSLWLSRICYLVVCFLVFPSRTSEGESVENVRSLAIAVRRALSALRGKCDRCFSARFLCNGMVAKSRASYCREAIRQMFPNAIFSKKHLVIRCWQTFPFRKNRSLNNDHAPEMNQNSRIPGPASDRCPGASHRAVCSRVLPVHQRPTRAVPTWYSHKRDEPNNASCCCRSELRTINTDT